MASVNKLCEMEKHSDQSIVNSDPFEVGPLIEKIMGGEKKEKRWEPSVKTCCETTN